MTVLELVAESETSWEDATQKAVTKASKTLEGIKSVMLKILV